MTRTSDPDNDLSALIALCQTRSISLIRGPDTCPYLIYIRQDLSVWSDESQSRHISELSDAEIEWAQNGIEQPDPQSKDFLDEAHYWHHIYGFTLWLEGGLHPLDLLAHRATGYRRAHADIDLSNQRVSTGGQVSVVTGERYAMLESDSVLKAQATADPTKARHVWSSELNQSWREAEFEDPIVFCQDTLPTITARTPVTARRRRDGSWIFEHPLVPSWLCTMDSQNRRVCCEAFFHNGRDVIELGPTDVAHTAPSDDWFD